MRPRVQRSSRAALQPSAAGSKSNISSQESWSLAEISPESCAQRRIADELPAPKQPGAPWQTRLCMTHHTLHVIPFYRHTHTHSHSLISHHGGSLPNLHLKKIHHWRVKRESIVLSVQVHVCFDGVFSIDVCVDV